MRRLTLPPFKTGAARAADRVDERETQSGDFNSNAHHRAGGGSIGITLRSQAEVGSFKTELRGQTKLGWIGHVSLVSRACFIHHGLVDSSQ